MPLFLFMFTEDLTAFFDPDELGEQFIILKNGETLNGVLENDYIETNEIQGYAPVITCATADAVTLARNDELEHFETREKYKFILGQPDGTGVSRLILEKAA